MAARAYDFPHDEQCPAWEATNNRPDQRLAGACLVSLAQWLVSVVAAWRLLKEQRGSAVSGTAATTHADWLRLFSAFYTERRPPGVTATHVPGYLNHSVRCYSHSGDRLQ